jgi:hypothetical protein
MLRVAIVEFEGNDRDGKMGVSQARKQDKRVRKERNVRTTECPSKGAIEVKM